MPIVSDAAFTVIIVLLVLVVAIPFFTVAWWILGPLADLGAPGTQSVHMVPALRSAMVRFLVGTLALACANSIRQSGLLDGRSPDWHAFSKVPQYWFWSSVYVVVAGGILWFLRWLFQRWRRRARSVSPRTSV